jgi:hypothetical protein
MRRAATLALALVLPLLVSPSARAVGTGEPHILAPFAAQVVPQGWTGPVRIDFSDAAADTYQVWVECPPGEGDGVPPDDYFWNQNVIYDGSDDMFEASIPPLTTPTAAAQSCLVSVYPSGNVTDAQQAFLGFSVAAARLSISSVSAAPRVFYPRVRDGFRDHTTMHFTVSKPAAVRGRVKDVRGRTVRYVDLGRVQRNGAFTWRGAGLHGRPAPVGRYTLEVTATDPRLGTRRVASLPVRLAVGIRERHSVREVTGDRMTGSARSGGCSFTRDATAGTAALDCTGSGYVQAWYRFAVQRSAHAVRATLFAEAATGSTITRQLQRTGPKSYRAGLRLTGVGSVAIERVRLAWTWDQHL